MSDSIDPHRADLPSSESGASQGGPTYRFEIFLIALAAIVLEIAMTRVFSFKLYYYFTYLILGIALLGLGSGGVSVAIFSGLRAMDPRRLVAACSIVGGVLVPITYAVIALVQLNVTDIGESSVELVRLFVICVSLFVPFLLVGISLATIFGCRPDDMNRLYFADLVGAGIGCALVVPLFLAVTPPGAIMVAGAVLALAGVSLTRLDMRGWTALGTATAALLVGLALVPSAIPEPIPDKLKTMSPDRRGNQNVLYSAWSSVFRVDVLAFPRSVNQYTLHHDGNIGSALHAWDGKKGSLLRYIRNFRSLPFTVLDPEPKVLIIGAAGGQELQASLAFGAGHVTGVELNPVTVSLLTDVFADFTGNVANHPKVDLVNAEGRSFIERSDEKYDLIWLVAPDSYAAMNAASSGAFVLSESYLYTVEMVQEVLDHLKPNGIMAAQFGELFLHNRPNRTPRFVSTARHALEESGVEDFREHIIVATAPAFVPGSTTLISKTPFDEMRLERFRKHLDQYIDDSQIWYPFYGEPPAQPNSVQSVILAEGEQGFDAFNASYAFDLSPVRDDSPFFWHFTSFRDALFGRIEKHKGINDWEVATGERMLVILLVFASCFAAVFILLPTVKIRDVWQAIPYKLNAGLYFAALGLGFMFIEVCLIQKLTLFLGYPSYSLTVTLFSILIFSGVGSLVSGAYSAARNRALWGLLGCLALLTVGMQFGHAPVMSLFSDAGLPVRIAVAITLLAPVGLCLGAFMPIGVQTISALSEHEREYVAWGWAVNGFFSVVSSVSATILSMTFGFRWVLLLALVVYAIGVLALTRIPEQRSA